MNQILEPKFLITVLLIALFGFAYAADPSDQAMKGAIIAAFSAAYGFWIGSKGNDAATENTGKAFSAIEAAARAGVPTDKPQAVKVVNDSAEPVPTTTDDDLPEYAR